MDYVVGSIASLISGNVTPNRPKRYKKPLTPMKHQTSPNVTPKSQLVDDKSIFLSPTLQKKKAIVKKSPKRIFQNIYLDVTNEEGESNISCPKADKVKKHLKDELDTDISNGQVSKSPKSPKNNEKSKSEEESCEKDSKKKKKKRSSTAPETEALANESIDNNKGNYENDDNVENTEPKPKKKRKRSKSVAEADTDNVDNETDESENTSLKKKRKSKSSEKLESKQSENVTEINEESKEKVVENEADLPVKNKSSKKKRKCSKSIDEEQVDSNEIIEKQGEKDGNESPDKGKNKKRKKKSKKFENTSKVNPNAVTNKDSDSEHESDNEMHSENEEENKKTLNIEPAESSDEEDNQSKKEGVKEDNEHEITEEEIQRTLFVGNVPFSSKCKKEIKKIFNQYGQIETVRIRTIPVKDATVTPKLAVIKNELHPDRTTVHVYIKFADPASVNKALAANNTVLNGCHLRVTRSDSTGAAHDPKCSVFVGNIPFALEDEALRERFDKCGQIESIRIVRDKKTNAGKGFGYVNFKSKDGVELALTLTEEDLTIKNRILRVKRCTQLTHKKINRLTGKQGNIDKKGHQGAPDNKTWNKGKPQDNAEGAYRRIKRKNQDGSGPPNKHTNVTKKDRKEFVGLTAEKKKKQRFSKGQKKKKALSEILTKK